MIGLVSVIVPVYKQEKTIKNDLKRMAACLKQADIDFELLAVVDGRQDNSFKEIKSLRDLKIKSFQLEKNHGKGYAIRYGMARAKGEVIAFIDAGMEIDPKGLVQVIEIYEKEDADVVIGSKRHPQSVVTYPPIRRLLSFGYQTLTLLLFGLHVKDTQVGLKLFNREVLEDVLPRLLVKRYAFDIEILSVANHLGYKKIIEAPISLNYNFGQLTSAASWWVIKNMLIDTVAVFYRLKIKGYYNDGNKRKWVYDKDLDFKINVG